MFNRKLVFTAACLGMLVFGIVLTTLGAILPSVIERFGVDKAHAGSLFLLMSFGILIGSLVCGPVVDRYGYRGLLLLSLSLVLLGLEGIAFAPAFGWLQLTVLLVGLAGGVINGATNALVSDISEGERSAGLSLLGIFFGVGAVGVPFSLGMLLDSFTYSTLIAVVGLTVLLPIGLTTAIRFPVPKQAQGFPIRDGMRLTGDRVLLLMGLMLFLQSGMEITAGGWTATYFQEQMGLSGSRALFFLSLYWFGMMLARLVLGVVLRSTPAALVLQACIGLALLGSLAMIVAPSLAVAAVGTLLVGAGLAAGFPVVLGFVGDRYATLSGTAFSIVLAMALTGGMTLPSGTGLLGEIYGLRASLLIVPLGLCAQLIVFATVRRRFASVPAPAPIPTHGVEI